MKRQNSGGGVSSKKKLGLKADLKYRDSYIAVVDKANNFVYEKWGQEYLQFEYILSDSQVVKITSAGYECKPFSSDLILDNINYSVNAIGLNILVFNIAEKKITGTYYCNTYSDSALILNSDKDIEKQEKLMLDKIQDCFSAGCSVAQFCVDNGYRKPLIVAKSEDLLWQIYIQFHYSKFNVDAQYCLINAEKKIDKSVIFMSQGQYFSDFSKANSTKHDIVFVFTGATGYNRSYSPWGKTLYIDKILWHFINYTYAQRPVYDYLSRHSKVKVIMFSAPSITKNEYNTELEKWELSHNTWWLKSELDKSKGKEKIFTQFDHLGYTNEQVSSLLNIPLTQTDEKGCTKFNNCDDELLNIVNGKRQTAYQPEEYKNTIWVLGTCVGVGYGAPWDKTFESYLQKILVDNGEEYLVDNSSQYYWHRYQDIFYNLNALPVKDGDIILLCVQGQAVTGVPYFRTSDLFVRPHNYGEVFTDANHVNEIGYKVIAEKMYDYLKENNFFDDYEYPHKEITPPHMFGIPEWTRGQSYGLNAEQQTGLNEYKQTLKELHKKVFGRIGAIVMNCNPFTLGHRYLIEYAAKQVSHLFIFAVEEDKSVFPFSDRIELIRKGTADLNNVTVLPSGKYVISSLTFSDYFNKSKLQDTTIDPSMDVELFATQIAPELGITVRFAGEEPLDKVTMQYNNSMRQILPKYGIEFEEIPRKEFDGGVISASRVRACLKDNDFETISKIVSPTTLEYLKINYEELIKKL